MFSLFKAPKFCRECGRAIVHGPRTVYGNYDEQTGIRKASTTQEWWCPEVYGSALGSYFHAASFRHA